MIHNVGSLEVGQESIVVVYDAQTGRITHMHYCVTEKGGKHPRREALERDAMEQFSQAQPRVTRKMALLHVNPKGMKPDTLYKVDTRKRVLVEIRQRKTARTVAP
ncbi:MAG: hypothetical protein HYY76_17860 [Acidobacteria bacterium]|nr:hypothetical protein [Acidobacteriota bacterium]